jgi:F-type H+-transporting ATPase subunit a
MHGHGFNWLSFIPGLDVHEYGHVVMTIIICSLVLIAALIARAQLATALKREDEGLIPDAKHSFRNTFEILAEKLYALAEDVMGKESAKRYFTIVGTLFVFIFASNFVGLIPGLLPPTDNLNTTMSLGIFVFLFYNYVGVREGGLAYFKHFAGPVLWLAPLMLVVEIASHVFRPISLGLRLRGNIMGDHITLGIFNNLTPYLVPVIFYGIGLFVSLVQAFVFCLMTMVYIKLSATTHEHDH